MIAIRRLTELARREALVMSFADLFLVLTLVFAALIALILLMERPVPVAQRR
jgi:DHA2 family multidrug resistance protein